MQFGPRVDASVWHELKLEGAMALDVALSCDGFVARSCARKIVQPDAADFAECASDQLISLAERACQRSSERWARSAEKFRTFGA
jgi:hypothetical protein